MKKIISLFYASLLLLLTNIASLHAATIAIPYLENPANYANPSYTAISVPVYFKTDKPWLRIINTQEEWQALHTEMWRQSENGKLPPPAPSAVDFNQYRVVMGGVGGISDKYNPIFNVSNVVLGKDITYIYLTLFISKDSPDCLGSGSIIDSYNKGVLIKKTNPLNVIKITLSNFTYCSQDAFKDVIEYSDAPKN